MYLIRRLTLTNYFCVEAGKFLCLGREAMHVNGIYLTIVFFGITLV